MKMRNTVTDYTVTEEKVVTHWSPLPGIEVMTTTIPSAHGHIREHVVSSDLVCVAYDCGFAMYNRLCSICHDRMTVYYICGSGCLYLLSLCL